MRKHEDIFRRRIPIPIPDLSSFAVVLVRFDHRDRGNAVALRWAAGEAEMDCLLCCQLRGRGQISKPQVI